VAAILARSKGLESAAQTLINEANRAGGRDNITVVLVRLEDVQSGADGAGDQPTAVGLAPAARVARVGEPGGAVEGGGGSSGRVAGTTTLPTGGADMAMAGLGSDRTAEDPQLISAANASRARAGVSERATTRRGTRRATASRGIRRKPVAILVAVIIVVCLVVAGGYLASRQLYFIGTNSEGVVTIYRGLPYDLPAGIHLYETFYVSGVPASLLPPDRRSALLDNRLRSESSAASVVRALELGRITK
jgi:protein phosphatase